MSEPGRVSSEDVLRRYQGGERDFQGLEIDDLDGKAPFHGAALDGADFSRAFIVADFRNASLRQATFVNANVKTCSYSGADLTNADFTGAALCSTTFSHTRMDGARFDGAFVH